MSEQNLEAPLFFAFISLLIRPKLFDQRSSSGLAVVAIVEFLNRIVTR